MSGGIGTGGWADYDNDGDWDLVVSNVSGEVTLYQNNEGTFSPVSNAFPAGAHSGCNSKVWGDYDNDGLIDLFLAGSSDRLMRNKGDGTFELVHSSTKRRGAAWSDYDNDGDLDIFVSSIISTDYMKLYQNDLSNSNNWLELNLVGVNSSTDGIGAEVSLVSGSLVQMRQVEGASSWASQNSLRLHFGLGDYTSVDSLTIRWASGLEQTLTDISLNQTLTVTEGVEPIPEPGTILLMGFGILGLLGVVIRQRRKTK